VTLAVPSVAWVFPNADAAGYYRFDLPRRTCRTLADHAAERLSVVERVAFLGNAQALLDAGRVDGARFLEVSAASAATRTRTWWRRRSTRWARWRTRSSTHAPRRVRGRTCAARCGPRSTAWPGAAGRRGRGGHDAAAAASSIWLGEYGDDAEVRRQADALAERVLAGDDGVPASLRAAALRVRALSGDRRPLRRVPPALRGGARRRPTASVSWRDAGFRDPPCGAEVLAWALTLRPQELGQLAAGSARARGDGRSCSTGSARTSTRS
jgi:alanyl aminopeptidase